VNTDASASDPDSQSFDGSLEGWEAIHKGGFFSSPGVLALAVYWSAIPDAVSTGFLVCKHFIRTEEGETFFEHVLTALPSRYSEHLWGSCIDKVGAVAKQKGADDLTQRILRHYFAFGSLIVTSLSAQDLLLLATAAPAGSVFIVPAADLYRFNGSEAYQPANEQQTFGDILQSEVSKLLRSLLDLARSKLIWFIVMLEPYGHPIRYLLNDVWDDPDLMVNAFGLRTQPQIASLLDPALNAFETGGIRALEQKALESGIPVPEIAIELFDRMLAEGRPGTRLLSAIPDLCERVSPHLLIEAARQSADKEQMVQAADLLEKALRSRLPLPLEGYVDGYWTARKASVQTAQDKLFRMAQRLFPNHPLSLQLQITHLSHQKRFKESLPLAEALANPLLIAEASALSNDKLSLKQYFSEAEKGGALEDAVLNAAEEAHRRRLHKQAVQIARKVSADHSLFKRAFRLRIRACGQGLITPNQHFFLGELAILCGIAASNPTNPYYRDGSRANHRFLLKLSMH
jgi:hypothetical protein